MRQPRLQARAERESEMSPLVEFDQRLERIISEFALRIAVPRWTEFDTVWEAAIRVCDRYELGKSKPPMAGEHLSRPAAAASVTSSAEASATDAPAQIHPPVAA